MDSVYFTPLSVSHRQAKMLYAPPMDALYVPDTAMHHISGYGYSSAMVVAILTVVYVTDVAAVAAVMSAPLSPDGSATQRAGATPVSVAVDACVDVCQREADVAAWPERPWSPDRRVYFNEVPPTRSGHYGAIAGEPHDAVMRPKTSFDYHF